MSVLTITGSSVPDPTLCYDYKQASVLVTSLPPHPAPTIETGAFTRPQRRSSYISSTAAPQSQMVTNHHHSRTISSNTLPNSGSFGSSNTSSPAAAVSSRLPPASSHSRQSSTSTNPIMSMHRQATTASATSIPRRSTSGRSTATTSPTSYVALMRKQKATVWCDRAQNIDPRIAAAQKQARYRAALAVQGVGQGRTSTISSGGVVGKIRHGGVPKAPGYVPANLTGASVPMRLSANEADEEEGGRNDSMVHGRSGSGRSSTNSAYRSGYPRPDQGRFSSNSTPPREGSPPGIPEKGETPQAQKDEYFDGKDNQTPPGEDSEDSFGELKELSGPNAVKRAMEQASKAEDLRRRGSVDERTMSMGQPGVRLYVANPDLDD